MHLGEMLFSTSCDFPSISTRPFSALLVASETSYLDVAKYYEQLTFTELQRGFIFRLLPVSL